MSKRCIHRHTQKEHPNCFKSADTIRKQPKILLFDVETTPMEVYTWTLKTHYISPDNVIKDRILLSWAAKWLFEPFVYSEILSPENIKENNDKPILEPLWSLLDEADIVIAHNGNRFDIPFTNARFLVNKFKAPSPYKTIDTKSVLKSNFLMSSNKLDYITKLLKLAEKKDVDFELWKKCVAGDINALKKMKNYNIQDVIALEDLYVEIRPWIKSHPAYGLYTEGEEGVCPVCGSNKLVEIGVYRTTKSVYKSFRCECGAVSRNSTNTLNKEKRKNLLTN